MANSHLEGIESHARASLSGSDWQLMHSNPRYVEGRLQRRMGVIVALLFLLWATEAAPAAEVQVNSVDTNATNLDNFTTESETNVAIAGSMVVVGYNTSRQAGLLGAGSFNSLSGFAWSSDGGASFTDGGFVPAGGNVLGGDPAVAFDGAGTLYYASIGSNSGRVSRIFVSQSTATTPAVTFANPVIISGVLGGSAPFQDKELIAVDTSGGPFNGQVYVAWSEFPSVFSSTAQVLLAASSSQSPLAFSAPFALSPSTGLNHGAMPAVAPNGDVYVVWASFASTTAAAAEQVHIVRSTNGGGAFSNPDPSDPAPSKTIASVTSTIGNMNSGGINIRTRGFPYIAIDRTAIGSATRGNIYVVFQATPGNGSTSRSEIFFTRSTDHGVTWSAPRDITSGLAVALGADTTANDNWQPSIAVSPTTGHIRVTFYSRRQDPANTKISVFEAGSTDGGLTWFNQPLSGTAFQPSTGYDQLLVPTYMGDYIHIAPAAASFQAAWGDTRNTCAPPAVAAAPCSPAGRGDQDVFFASSTDTSGPDDFITPWGAVTGIGPLWQSPDIFVVDAFNNPVNAAKGVHNRLRGRVRNIGSAPEASATVRFRYAPIYIGLPDSALKVIATPAVSLATAGDPSGDDLKVVPADWDLTDLTDTNGGVWPAPISDFDHFCVRVDIQSGDDVNLANNRAQTNFVDVSDAGKSGPLGFQLLVGNPFEKPVRLQLMTTPLPRGYAAELRVAGMDNKFLTLNPREIRVASLILTRPPNFNKERLTTDVVANVSMLAGSVSVGGVSVRLAKAMVAVTPPPSQPVAQGQPAPASAIESPLQPTTTILQGNEELIVRAATEVLRLRDEPIALVDPERGLVSSGSVPLRGEALQQVVPERFLAGMPADAEGRYLVSFHIEKAGDNQSRVTIEVRVILGNSLADSPIGGMVVASNGTLEKRYLQLLSEEVQRLR